MPFQRDPLSITYDSFSLRFLDILREDFYGWHTATVRSPASDPIDRRGLSATERAVQRSLYYVLNSTGMIGPNGGAWVKNDAESLQLSWDDPGSERPQTRNILRRFFGPPVRVRVLRGRLAAGELARYHVPADGYVFNPDEQSQNLGL